MLALLRFVLRGLAARNILRRVWFSILRVFQFCARLLSRLERATVKGQQTNAGRATTPKVTASTGGNVPLLAADDPSCQLPVTTSIPPLLPLSTEESTQETTQEHSRRNTLEPTIFEDASTNTIQQPVQPECGESVQLHNYPPIELPHVQRSDLLALAKPVVPEQLQRYKRKLDRSETSCIEEIQAQKLDYTWPQVPEWDRIVHPEGAPYFFANRSMPVYTDTDLSIPQHRTCVEDFIPVLINAVTRADVSGHSLALVLKLTYEGVLTYREQQCFYYFIDHSKRLIFWVHPVKSIDICGTIRKAKSEGHLRYAIETHYWFVLLVCFYAPNSTAEESKVTLCLSGRHHCELYPSDVTSWLTSDRDGYLQLRGMLIHANADSILSDTAMGPFETTDLQGLVDITSLIEGCCASSTPHRHVDIYVATIWAKVMRLFIQYRFLNSCGQFSVRLGRGRAVFKTAGEKPVPQILLQSALPFWTLMTFLRDILVDGMIDKSSWKTYISNLKSDCDSYTLYSTVMLAVDISFLAVPVVQSRDTSKSDASRYLIYWSIIASVGTIIVSVNLANQIRKPDADADHTAAIADDILYIGQLVFLVMLPPIFLQLTMWCFVTAVGTVVLGELDRLGVGMTMAFYAFVIYLALYPSLVGLFRFLLRGIILWWTSRPTTRGSAV
ncbi:hypothetical protein BU15DRAFT_77620 [Melanogaster broomeanus]|nr:hypothetical protein BU15DRAFT_77620 [Melanogaster broomeanus]